MSIYRFTADLEAGRAPSNLLVYWAGDLHQRHTTYRAVEYSCFDHLALAMMLCGVKDFEINSIYWGQQLISVSLLELESLKPPYMNGATLQEQYEKIYNTDFPDRNNDGRRNTLILHTDDVRAMFYLADYLTHDRTPNLKDAIEWDHPQFEPATLNLPDTYLIASLFDLQLLKTCIIDFDQRAILDSCSTESYQEYRARRSQELAVHEKAKFNWVPDGYPPKMVAWDWSRVTPYENF